MLQHNSGKVVKIFTSVKTEELKNDFDHKDGNSQRQAAIKFKCSSAIVNCALKKSNISCQKKRIIP